MLEGLQDKVRGRRGGKVDEDHLEIGKVLESCHQGHGLTGTWRTTQQEWAMLTDPRAEHLLMTSGIDSCDNDISFDYLARFDFNAWHLFLPQVPLLVFDSYFKVNQWILSDGREGDTGEFTKSISEICSCLKIHGPSDTPLGSENHILLHEGLNLDISKVEILACLIELYYI